LRAGLMQAISQGAVRTVSVALESGVSRVSSLAGAVKKGTLRSIYGNRGFDIRELCTWETTLKNNAATVLKFATGARVVRAHVVLNQDPSNAKQDAPSEQQQVFQSVATLKNGMVYIVQKLNEYEPYYKVQPGTTARSWTDCLLDAGAAAGVIYIIADFFRQTEDKVADNFQQWQKVWLAQQHAEATQRQFVGGHGATTLHHGVITHSVSAGDLGGAASSAAAPGAGAALGGVGAHQQIFRDALISRMGQSAAEFAARVSSSGKTTMVIKAGLGIFALVRLVQWLRSKDAINAANALTDVNRDLIVHLIGAVRDNLNYLIAQCNSVKQESDLVRIKDDVEFISKNCGDALVQIAYLIDQDEALKAQRLSKPGQTASSYGQGSSLGSLLPKL